jgi:hypothetical protein
MQAFQQSPVLLMAVALGRAHPSGLVSRNNAGGVSLGQAKAIPAANQRLASTETTPVNKRTLKGR